MANAFKACEVDFRILVEQMAALVFVADEAGRIVYVSPHVREMLGYSPEEVVGLHLTAFLPQELSVKVMAQFFQVIQQGTPVKGFPTVILRRDGVTLSAEIDASLYQNGSFLGVMGIIRDLSERNSMEKALQESERKAATLISNLPGFVYRCANDRNWTMQFISEGCLEITGYRAADLLDNIQLCYNDLVHPDYQEFLWQKWQDQLAKREAFEAEYPIITAGGDTHWVWERGRGVFSPEGQILFLEGFITDISERKRAEEVASRRKEEMGIFYRASQRFGETLQLDQVHEALFDSIASVIPCDALYISRYEPETRMIHCAAGWMNGKKVDVSDYPPVPLAPTGRGVQSLVIREGIARVLNDYPSQRRTGVTQHYVSDDGKIKAEVQPEEQQPQSCLVAPIKVKGGVTGIIQVFSYQGNAYNEDHLRLVTALSSHAGAAISNAHLYREAQEEVRQRRLAEDALRLSEARYRLLVQAQQDLVTETDLEGRLLFVNAAYCALFGKTAEELIGSNYAPLIHPDDLPLVARSIASLASPPYECSFEERAKTRFGWRWLSWTDKAVLNHQGVATTLVGTGRDITERKQAEEALRESEERFRAIAEQISDVVFITDAQGVITYLSPAATKVFGVELDEMLGIYFPELLPPESVEAAVAAFTDAIERGIPRRNLELKMNRNDGSKFIGELTGSLFQVGGFTGIAGTIRDITERKQLEREAEQARADFLYAVSHELKTPLFLMTAGLELFKGLPPEERQRKYLEQEEVWQRNLLRLRFLINNLVDSQRTKTIGLRLSRVSTDLTALVRQAVADLNVLVQRQNLHVELDLTLIPLLMLDAEAVERTLHNLLSNAIKFSPPGGKIQVRLGLEEDGILLEVKDHGQGIPAEALPHLFQPFARAGSAVKAVVPGTGLGLYVSRILIEAHGGTISLSSELGQGATVTVRLPMGESGK